MAAVIRAASADEALIDLIYDTALDGSQWSVLLGHLGDRIGAGPANLTELDIVSGKGWGVGARVYEGAMADYFAHWSHRNPMALIDDPFDYRVDWAPRIMPEAASLDRATLERSAFWNEFLVPVEASHTLSLRLALRGDDLTTLQFGRGGHHGAFGETEMAALRPFHRHLMRAEILWRRFGRVRTAGEQVDALVAAAPDALLLVDERLRIMSRSPAADALLRKGGAIGARGERLTIPDPYDEARLRGLLEAALKGGAPAPIYVAGSRPGEGVTLSAARLGPGATGAPPGGRSVLVNLRADAADPAIALRAQYDFTPAEVALALALASGRSLGVVAAARDVSIHTVRTQLRAIFDKTGWRRQAELVRALAGWDRAAGE